MSLPRYLLILPPALLASCSMHLPEPVALSPRVETRTMAVAAEDQDGVEIYLLSDNLHTALVFDLAWLERHGYVKPAQIGNHRYVAMSWGEKTAYVQKRWLNPFQVVKALCTPSDSVMEIIPIDWKVEEVCHHQDVYLARAERSTGTRLAAFLNGCAVKGPDGLPETIAPSSWGEGRLIRCPDNYSYYFPRICNVWTAQALGNSGFTMSTTGAISASGVVRQATRDKNSFKKIHDGDDA